MTRRRDPIAIAVAAATKQPQPSRNGKGPRTLTDDEIKAINEGRDPFAPAAVITTLASVSAKPVLWLWQSWIPAAALTLLDGDPGLGKSTITLDLAARVSRGWRMPPDAGSGDVAAAGVLLLSAEDAIAETIRPRLDAAGADVSRVHALESVRVAGDERPPVVPWDLAIVENEIKRRGIKLIVIDPFMAFLDGQLDAHRDQDVRRCLHRLKVLAEKTGVAIVLVRHLNKLTSSPAMYRGGGSIGITGAVRSALVVGRDPHDPAQHVIAPVKCNLAARPKALAYQLEPAGNVSRVGWIGEVDLLADDILGHQGGATKKTKTAGCAEAIGDLLATGPMESADFEARLRDAGYGETTIKAARRQLGVRAWGEGFGKDRRWMVCLPGAPSTDDVAEDEPEPEPYQFP